MTSNGVMAVTLPYFTKIGTFGANYVTAVEVRPTLSEKEI